MLPRSSHRSRFAHLATALILALALGGLRPARAATDVNLADCTEPALRDAVLQASGGGTIFFSCGGPATIRLTQSLLIAESLRIVGDRLVTLSGGGTTRVITVRSGATLTLDGVTISDGATGMLGGAVLNEGTLIAEDVAFIGSRAASGGALYSTGPAELTRATFRGNQATNDGGAIAGSGAITLAEPAIIGNSAGGRGGGIAAAGDLAIDGGALRGNTARDGGGAVVTGRAALTSVTIAENRAVASGGGVLNDGTLAIAASAIVDNSAASGGGMENRATLTITNSTVSGNRADTEGGGVRTSDSLALRSVTVAENSVLGGGGGGGILVRAGAARLRGSLLAGNTADAGPDCLGALASDGNNLVEVTEGCAVPAAGNLLGVDPRLAPLGDNGGPTATHSLAPDSPAVDAVPRTDCPLEDQRRVGRPVPVSGSCDIGAYELGFVVNSLADAPDASPRDGVCATAGDAPVCTLRAAIQAANDAPGTDAIAFAGPGTVVLSIQGADEDQAETGDLDITDDLLLIGLGAEQTTIDGRGALADRIFAVESGVRATLVGVTVQGGATSDRGGGIRNDGDLTLRGVVIAGNSAGFGGGVANFGALEASNVALRDNSASFGGGGIQSQRESRINPDGGRLALTDSTVSGNAADGLTANGGGLDLSGDAELANVTVSGNRADQNGGGLIVAAASSVQLNNLTVAGNTADADEDGQGDGGGIFTPPPPPPEAPPEARRWLIVQNTIVAGNSDGSETLVRPDCQGNLTSYGHNLVGITSDCFEAPRQTDQLGSPTSPIDARVGALASNGGRTQTRALLAGSPALNAGSPAAPGSQGESCTAADQRLLARPIGARCDIGASEALLASFQVEVRTLSRSIWLIDEEVEVLVAVRSRGPSDTRGARVEISLPPLSTPGGATPNLGSCRGTAPIVCDLGAMASGSAATISVRFTPRLIGPSEVLAAASSAEIDPTPLSSVGRARESVSYGLFLPLAQR